METFREYYLKEKTEDKRDYSHTAVFGAAKVDELPQGDFFIGDPMEIKNQDINYLSDFCAAYAAAAAAEDHERTLLVPEYTFAKAKQLKAKDVGAVTEEAIQEVIQEFGLELRDICMAGCKYGFLEREHDFFHCNTEERPERNTVADWRKWPEDLDMLAWEHAQNSFFSIDGPYDTFDNLRNAMWKHKGESCSIVTGMGWRQSWVDAPKGMINKDTYSPDERSSGHAFKIFGQIELDNKFGEKELYLVAQLSDGPQNGDKGLYYFSREVVNAEAKYGAYMFNDMPREKAKFNADFQINISDSIWKKAWKVLVYWFTNFIIKK